MFFKFKFETSVWIKVRIQQKTWIRIKNQLFKIRNIVFYA